MKFHIAYSVQSAVAKIQFQMALFLPIRCSNQHNMRYFPSGKLLAIKTCVFFPSENAVTTSCLHEGAVEGFIEDLRKII